MFSRLRSFPRHLRTLVLKHLSLRQRLLMQKAVRLTRRLFARTDKPVLEIGKGLNAESPMHALVCYVTKPFRIPQDSERFYQHESFWRSAELARILNSMGYVVDVVHYTDRRFVPKKDYDLFIGHGTFNFERIASRLKARATKIYLFSGCYWAFHNREELARFEDLRRRRGVSLPPDRLVARNEDAALKMADGFMGVGGEYARRTFDGFSPVYVFPTPILSEEPYDPATKDFDAGRNHFLYFAGPGNVHKGLDLLLEVFTKLDRQHLWVCSPIEPAFAKIYEALLTRKSNIHLLQHIPLRSPLCHEVMQRCNWIVLPSCAEGQANSVVQCMNRGLIPVVSPACGLNVKETPVILHTCSIEEIASAVRELSRCPTADCERMSRAARKIAVTEHSKELCSQRMRAAIRGILQEKSERVQET